MKSTMLAIAIFFATCFGFAGTSQAVGDIFVLIQGIPGESLV